LNVRGSAVWARVSVRSALWGSPYQRWCVWRQGASEV
jgi:hypothetical protein